MVDSSYEFFNIPASFEHYREPSRITNNKFISKKPQPQYVASLVKKRSKMDRVEYCQDNMILAMKNPILLWQVRLAERTKYEDIKDMERSLSASFRYHQKAKAKILSKAKAKEKNLGDTVEGKGEDTVENALTTAKAALKTKAARKTKGSKKTKAAKTQAAKKSDKTR